MTDLARILKNIPMPQVKRRGIAGRGKQKYPWDRMEIGDAFQFTGPDPRAAYGAVSNANRYFQPKKFIAGKHESMMLIWRRE